MIRKMVLGLLAIIVLAAAAFFIFAPGIADRSMNVVDGKPLPEISDEARALHETLTIVDLHSDTLLWKRDMLDANEYGHMDLARLREGNVALQVFSSVTKTPKNQNYDSNSSDGDNVTLLVIGQLQPVRTWNSLLERSLFHAQKLDEASRNPGTDLLFIKSSGDVEGLVQLRSDEWIERMSQSDSWERPIGGLFSAEGLHSLEGDIDNLEGLYGAGMRMAGLTHFFDNELAGSMHGEEKGGLTDFGRAVVREMEERGMIVDIAHCSRTCVSEVLAMARRPVVSSHGGVQATCDVNRNLSDEHIRGVAATGGIIGIGYWEGAVCDTSPAAIAAAMRHVRDLVGIEHVALGSDYDGSVTVRFDTAGLVHVTQALMEAGFTDEEIRAAMGGNAIRVISEGLLPLSDVPAPAQSEEG